MRRREGEEPKSDFGFLKYCFAVHTYKKGNAEHRVQRGKGTVAELFEKKFGENYYDYIKRKMKEKRDGES